MKQRILNVTALLLISAFTILVSCNNSAKKDPAATTDDATTTKAQDNGKLFAARMYNALDSEKFDTYLQYLDDVYIKRSAKTKDSVMDELKRDFAIQDQEKNSFQFQSVDIVAFKNCNSERQGIFKISENMKLHNGATNLPMKVFLFGYSKDDGSTWKFFRIDSTYRDISNYHDNACVLDK